MRGRYATFQVSCVAMTNWSVDLVARIAGALKRQRESSSPRITATELSRRTAELGLPMSRAVISDLETGRKRTLDISELIVLARALDVPPLQLIYPDLPDGRVEAWPGYEDRSILAAQWFSGEDMTSSVIHTARQLEDTRRELDHRHAALSDARARLIAAEMRGDTVDVLNADISHLEGSIALLSMRLSAGAVEAMDAGLTVDVDQLADPVRDQVISLLAAQDADNDA